MQNAAFDSTGMLAPADVAPKAFLGWNDGATREGRRGDLGGPPRRLSDGAERAPIRAVHMARREFGVRRSQTLLAFETSGQASCRGEEERPEGDHGHPCPDEDKGCRALKGINARYHCHHAPQESYEQGEDTVEIRLHSFCHGSPFRPLDVGSRATIPMLATAMIN